MTRILLTGKTGSGKTEYIITKTKEFIENFHRVFHVVPLTSLKSDIYHRYKAKYGEIVGREYDEKRKIFVLTYHEYNQVLTKKPVLFYDVVVFDEFHTIIEPFFTHVVYSAIKNTKSFYQEYLISATPVPLDFITIDERIDLKSNYESKFTIEKIGMSDITYIIKTNLEQNKTGFDYVGSISNTVNKAIKYAELSPHKGDKYETDDPILSKLLEKKVAFISSNLTFKDRDLIMKLLEDKEIKLLLTTTSINYGIDVDFDYAIFESDLYLDRIRTEQFFGRVGRRRQGTIYIVNGLNIEREPRKLVIDSDIEDFARLIALDEEYLCQKYPSLCRSSILKEVAYHLVHPKMAEMILNLDLRNIDDKEYMICVTAMLKKQSLDMKEECAKNYEIVADRETYDLIDDWINLRKKKLNGTEIKQINELSYLAHILGVMKSEKYDKLSIAIKYGIRYEDVDKLVELLKVPYIGRMRAYKLYERGITMENICERYADVKEIMGKIADKIFRILC